MKVLEKGNGPTVMKLELRCTGKGNNAERRACGALLEVEEADLFITESGARDETTYYVTFECPECGARTDLTNYHEYGIVLHDLPTYAQWRRKEKPQ